MNRNVSDSESLDLRPFRVATKKLFASDSRFESQQHFFSTSSLTAFLLMHFHCITFPYIRLLLD